jgi:signal transduction histidine kinase
VAFLGGGVVGLLMHQVGTRRRQADRQRFESESRKLADERASLAAAAERERIYNDLHDDLGARLLQLVYAAPTVELADQARAALQDLRDVVSRSRGCAGTLEDVLADIEREARQRLGSAGIELDWQITGALPGRDLPHGRALHLYRIVREAISNALRHAQPSLLRVRLRLIDDLLALELSDDGGRGADLGAPGQGMRSMQQRAEALHGAIRWTRGSAGGAKVVLTVPLNDAAGTEPRTDPG